MGDFIFKKNDEVVLLVRKSKDLSSSIKTADIENKKYEFK